MKKYNFSIIFLFLKNLNFSLTRKKKKFLILDSINKKHFYFLKKEDIFYIDTRGKYLNFFVLLISIFYFLTSKASLFQSYIIAHIKFYKSEILISNQEVINFFDVKFFIKNIKTIFIQLDSKDEDSLEHFDKLNTKIDYIFCTGKYWADIYKKSCLQTIIYRKQFLFKKNLNNFNYSNKKIIYISTFRKNLNLSNKYFIDYNKNHIQNDFFLLNIIKKICLKYKLDLIIIPTYKPKNESINLKELINLEKNYYNNILKGFNFKLIYKGLENFYISNQNSLYVNIDSTLGYELILKGFKCVFFPIRNNVIISEFKNLPKKGKIWLKYKNYFEIKKIIINNFFSSRKTTNLLSKKIFRNFYSSSDDSLDLKLTKLLTQL
tara:strand:+ start:363 stop:1493 length:1131 start_codon:yes stop_codon:yes gene_type:complete